MAEYRLKVTDTLAMERVQTREAVFISVEAETMAEAIKEVEEMDDETLADLMKGQGVGWKTRKTEWNKDNAEVTSRVVEEWVQQPLDYGSLGYGTPLNYLLFILYEDAVSYGPFKHCDQRYKEAERIRESYPEAVLFWMDYFPHADEENFPLIVGMYWGPHVPKIEPDFDDVRWVKDIEIQVINMADKKTELTLYQGDKVQCVDLAEGGGIWEVIETSHPSNLGKRLWLPDLSGLSDTTIEPEDK